MSYFCKYLHQFSLECTRVSLEPKSVIIFDILKCLHYFGKVRPSFDLSDSEHRPGRGGGCLVHQMSGVKTGRSGKNDYFLPTF